MKPIHKMSPSERGEYICCLHRFLTENSPLTVSSLTTKTSGGSTIFDRAVELASVLRVNNEQLHHLYNKRLSDKERLSRLTDMLERVDKYIIEFYSSSHLLPDTSSSPQATVTSRPIVSVPMPHIDSPLPRTVPNIHPRPQHLSEYIHLLPAHIQERSKQLQQWYNEMAYAHSTLQSLVLDNPLSSKSERARFAQAVCRKEDRINLFWDLVDAYWERCQGKTVSDELLTELESRYAVLTKEDSGELPSRLLGSYSKSEIDAMPEGEFKESAKKARILRNQKFLRRSDRSKKIDSLQIESTVEELHLWGIWITPLQARSAKEYGYEVPAEYISPDSATRKKMSIQRYEDKRKQARKQHSDEMKKMKEEIKNDNPYMQQGFNFLD